MKNKKAISGIVTTVLLIAISLIAVLIVWNVISGVIEKSSGDVDTGVTSMFTEMEIQNVYVSTDGKRLVLSVSRARGDADVPLLTCTVSTPSGSGSFELIPSPGPQQTKVYPLNIEGINSHGNVEGIRVACAPVFSSGQTGSPEEYTTQLSDNVTAPPGHADWTTGTYTDPEVRVCTPYSDCVNLECAAGKIMKECTNYGEDCEPSSSTTAFVSFCPPEDYVLWWKFESTFTEGPNTKTLDETGINNGTLYGTISLTGGKVGNAFQFVGSLRHRVNVSLDVPATGSMIFWINGSNASGMQLIENIYPVGWQSTHSAIGLSSGTSPNSGLIANDGVNYYYRWGDKGFFNNNWNHYVLTWDEVNVYLYQNGTAIGSQAHSEHVYAKTGKTFSAGAGWYNTYGTFNGSIDNVMIYPRALTPDEVKAVYCSQGGDAAACAT